MAITGETGSSTKESHLFMLRLWREDLGSGQTDWRGRVQHINSGETRYFRDWPTLKVFMERLLRQIDLEENPANGMDETDRGTR